MEDREIGLFWREWFLEKQKDSQASPEDYLIRTYLEWHEKDPLGEAEKRARIKERIQTWKETRDGFLRMIDRYPDTAGMEEWQAAQMLENVMQELQLDRADACRYLANVKKMIYDNLLFAVGEPAASALRPDFEKSYEEAWQNADLADESALSLLFSETVSLMRYAGLSFEEDTQRILAETALGREQTLSGGGSGQAGRDICLLTDFLVSEMVLSEKGELSVKEQTALAKYAVPVYTAAVSCIDGGEKPGHILKQAQIYISRIFHGKGLSAAVCLAAVLLAVEIVWELLTLAAAGAVVGVGMLSLWKACRNAGKQKDKEGREAVRGLRKEGRRIFAQRLKGRQKALRKDTVPETESDEELFGSLIEQAEELERNALRNAPEGKNDV